MLYTYMQDLIYYYGAVLLFTIQPGTVLDRLEITAVYRDIFASSCGSCFPKKTFFWMYNFLSF